MNEVYCNNCRYMTFSDWRYSPIVSYICKKNPARTITPIEVLTLYSLCSVKNADNDCKDYEITRWKKIWKSLTSGILN